MAVCVIWTGVTNNYTCIKYLESVLYATFIGTSYSTVHGTITVYEYDTMHVGTLAHAYWVRVSFPEVQSLVDAGRTDVQIAWPLWVRVFKMPCSKRTAAIKQAGAGSQTLPPETVAFLTFALGHWNRVHICIRKGNYREVCCLGEHNIQGASPLELTSKVITEFADNGTSRGLHKKRYCRIDVISELKWMSKMPSGPSKM